ncbi:hypothetical protein B0E53_06700 [Micromonospora sp. MH33]|nr:hypothetical protein B0E53_06700 [Micromonospora sp. MH33]
MPGGQPGDHEVAQPGAVGRVELRGAGELAVRLGQGRRRHAEPPVGDLDGVAARHGPAGDVHPGAGRGEDGGVLDQLGEQVDHVADRAAEHPGRLHLAHVDPVVGLDLGDRAAHYVDRGDRVAPAPPGGRAGQDDQVLSVPPEPGGEVVDLEQPGQLVRVLGPPLQPVQQRQLPVHQALAAPGDVEEHLVEAAAQGDLVDGGLDGGPAHLVEGPAHLADLVAAVVQLGRLAGDVDLLAATQPGHHVRQPVLGHLQRGGADPGEPPVQRPADPQRHQYADHDGEQAEHPGGGEPEQDADRHRHGPLGEGVGATQLEVPQALRDRGVAGLPGPYVEPGRQVAGADQGVLEGAQPDEPLPLGEPLVPGAFGGRQVGHRVLGQEALVLDGADQLLVLALGVPAGGDRAGQQRVGLAEQLPGPAQRGERQRLPVELDVGQRGHAGERLEGGADHPAVEPDGAGPVHLPAVDEAPAGGQRVERGDQLVEPGVELVVGGVAQLLPADPAPQLGDGPVGAGALLGQRRQGGVAGELDDREPAFPLQLGDHALAGPAQVIEEGARGEQVEGRPEGQRGGEDPECQQPGHRTDDQRGQLGADRPVSGVHQTSPGGRCRRGGAGTGRAATPGPGPGALGRIRNPERMHYRPSRPSLRSGMFAVDTVGRERPAGWDRRT